MVAGVEADSLVAMLITCPIRLTKMVSLPPILEGNVTNYVQHTASKLISSGNLTFDERLVVHHRVEDGGGRRGRLLGGHVDLLPDLIGRDNQIETFLAMQFTTRMRYYCQQRSCCVVNFVARKFLD